MAKKKRIKKENMRAVVSESSSKKIRFSLFAMLVSLVIFLVSLGVVSYVDSVNNKTVVATFGIIELLSGFVALTFLVIWLILLIIKVIKK